MSGAPTTVSPSALYFRLRDGVLGWSEMNGYGQGLKVTTANGVATTLVATTVSNDPFFFTVAGGRVLYAAGTTLHRWNAATTASSVVLDALPQARLQTVGLLYFTLGIGQSVVYKAALS